jgi:hypothetical protein
LTLNTIFTISRGGSIEDIEVSNPAGANGASSNTCSDKIHESDVYRTAITLFLSGDFTDSKDTGGFVIFLRHLKFILTGLVWFAVLMVTATGPDGLLVFVQMLPGVVLASLPLAWWLGKFIFSRLERRHE